MGVVTCTSPGSTVLQACARAWERARDVAAASGLSVRELSGHAEHAEAERLVSEIWTGETPVPRTIMRMVSSTGGYVAGAYRGAELVGVAIGFVAAPDGSARWHLHSHVAGIAPEHRGNGAGWAMKLHQRAWAMERDIETISWTFDPLVRRNAFFNLTKLGADATAYLVDFYGEMTDGVNVDQGSDRLWVRWELCSERAERAADGERVDDRLLQVTSGDAVEVALSAGPDGAPQEHAVDGRAEVLVCAVPDDVEAMRLADPGLARAWRGALRRAMTAALGEGWRIEGCTRTGRYVLAGGGRSGAGARGGAR